VPALLFSCSNGIIREKVTETLKGSHELHALLLITRNSFFFGMVVYSSFLMHIPLLAIFWFG
jgi:hypothetical protein